MSVHLSIQPTGSVAPPLEAFDAQRFAEYVESLQTPTDIASVHDLLLGLHALNGTRIRILIRQDLSDDIHRKLLRIISQLEAELFNPSVPLSPEKRAYFILADDLLAALSTSYTILLSAKSRRLFGLAASGRALVPVQRLMSIASRRIALAYRCYTSPPKGVWLELHELHQFATRRGLATRIPHDSTISPTSVYKRALLLAFIGPQRLTSDELQLATELIDRHADLAALHPIRSEFDDSPAFLVKPYRDQSGDTHLRDKSIRIETKDFLFDIGKVAKALLAESPPDATGHPGREDIATLLTRHWSASPSRQLNRLKTQAQVGIRVGLNDIWAHLNGTSAEGNAQSSWLVTNENPRGFALTHFSGPISPLKMGDLIGLFSPLNRSCHICVVRWMLSNTPAHIEIGLEELASSARPAVVRAVEDGSTGTPALLMREANATQDDPVLVISSCRLESQYEMSIGDLDTKLRLRPVRILEQMASTQRIQFQSAA